MDSLIDTFHIDWKLLLAQAVNFGLVFFVLYRFALKPLTKTMAQRSQKIEEGLKNAEDMAKKLAETQKEQADILQQARLEATEIQKQAQTQAEQRKQQLVQKAKEEVGAVIQAEKNKLHQEKAIVLKEIKEEMAELITLSLEKILKQKLDGQQDQDLIKKLIK